MLGPITSPVEVVTESKAWTTTVDKEILKRLPESEINRQT